MDFEAERNARLSETGGQYRHGGSNCRIEQPRASQHEQRRAVGALHTTSQYCTRVIAMQPLMVEPTGFTPKRNILKTFLLSALALFGVVCLFQSGAAAGRAGRALQRAAEES